jgi:hypothetical protein
MSSGAPLRCEGPLIEVADAPLEARPVPYVAAGRDLPRLPTHVVYWPNPICSAECEREFRRSWRLHWSGPMTCAPSTTRVVLLARPRVSLAPLGLPRRTSEQCMFA